MSADPTRSRFTPQIASLIIVLAAGASPHAAPGRVDDDAAARFDYLLHCSGCHRTDGTGSAPDVPSLRGPVGSLVGTPEGREYIARVPEVAQSPLDDEDLARLLNWMLREFNTDTLPARFRPLEGDEVGAARARILTDPLRARAAIIGDYRGKPSGSPGRATPRERDPG